MDAKVLCLGVLARGEATGYEIRKEFEEGILGHIQDAGFGSIYPALARLLEEERVAVRVVDQAGRPPRKIYSLTPRGRMALVDALTAPAERDRLRSDFLFRLLFAELLPARRLAAVIDSRVAELRAKVAEMEGCCDPHAGAGERFIHGYGLAIYRAAAAYLDEHKHEVLKESLLAELAVAE